MTRLVDLTRPVETGMPTYPGDPDVAVTPHATQEADGYRVSRLELGTHTGTHIDAPAHTERDGATLDSFDAERFRFDARLVDCRGVGANEAIGSEAVPETDAEMLVFRTGWEAEWGTDRMTEHPYLAPETAERCADAGYHVGIDALSPDPTGGNEASDGDADGHSDESGVPAHHALLGAGLLIVENLTNLGAVPERFELLALPLCVDADGAPVRAVARV
ncbi:kynurenine formamidase [Halogeometricum borinquense DSM 11551]|uniref:Kynurenine formamidase n=1 Tax=Halogeometricum borinquense (strain ATCC 700274 / DSM 11551 / JCM 10706 / KCTC 4070 / PR3) TaxID=469382 RepID=E4NR48_HALBP|nr:cyclase family protein [Halogeometricum borinquense]ADQ66784.1 Kynurenine formamidase [Halogeometricum borinquense DSM 11551]ELY30292.1 kynurenine formamidase [Halogeometricum borinquense DSM 11551]